MPAGLGIWVYNSENHFAVLSQSTYLLKEKKLFWDTLVCMQCLEVLVTLLRCIRQQCNISAPPPQSGHGQV